MWHIIRDGFTTQAMKPKYQRLREAERGVIYRIKTCRKHTSWNSYGTIIQPKKASKKLKLNK
ncbi:hypothetical protein [Rubritalea sp.]|uniref:hypothetical protein n=1 Tax=Rubritalea sp. TaxID=2109375 RepID=UPI003241EB2C